MQVAKNDNPNWNCLWTWTWVEVSKEENDYLILVRLEFLKRQAKADKPPPNINFALHCLCIQHNNGTL